MLKLQPRDEVPGEGDNRKAVGVAGLGCGCLGLLAGAALVAMAGLVGGGDDTTSAMPAPAVTTTTTITAPAVTETQTVTAPAVAATVTTTVTEAASEPAAPPDAPEEYADEATDAQDAPDEAADAATEAQSFVDTGRDAEESSPDDSSGGGPFANCSEARAAGVAPLHRGDDGYSSKLDRDGDGVACER